MQHKSPLPFAEFVALMAALMAMGALGIDAMLPALPDIGARLGIASENTRQYVITAFLVGLGAGQLLHGPLADRFGRRPTMLTMLALYVVATVLCAVSGSFTLLLAARFLAGTAIASTRVCVTAMVRDCYEGRAMARVMSISFIVFMIVPVLAPAFGTAVLAAGSWRAIFWSIVALTLAVLAWFAWRMPETMDPADRLPIAPARIAAGWRHALVDRLSLGYTLAAAALMGALYGYLNSIQQIVGDVFGRPTLLAGVFAATAATMAAANLLNARIVMRLGTRRISHGAVSLLILTSAAHLVLTLSGHEQLGTFVVLQAVQMACFGLAASNFSAMAMQNMGHIAGTASSVQGFLSLTLGAGVGALIGQSFDGSTAPLTAGFLLAGLAALAIVAATERGQLFRASA